MNTTSLLRRCFCCITSSSYSSSSVSCSSSNKKPLVFLGSPQVATKVLDALFNASESPDASFKVAAIVTQPTSQRGRGRKLLPSPVAQYAMERGFSPELIFTPERANEEPFLADLQSLGPELCVTAAYGNILPNKFLKIPIQGTVNIHPSLLPLYRGAAPVQRALQDGVKETGVSLAFTVRALDAGPVIASKRIGVDDSIKAPDLLDMLFGLGSELLVRELPLILNGTAGIKAQPQDDSKATLAPKIKPEESWLSFDEEAFVLHNKVRALAGWPGTRAKVQVGNANKDLPKILELKVITTRVSCHSCIQNAEAGIVTFSKGALMFPCGKDTKLEVLELQLPGKKVVTAAAFWNGFRGQRLKIVDREPAMSQL